MATSVSTSQPGRTESRERHRRQIGEADIGAVALDREDVAVDAHRQGGDGVMTVLAAAWSAARNGRATAR